MSSKRKSRKINKMHKKRQTKQNGKEEVRKTQNQELIKLPLNQLTLTLLI
jgi:hypothetical protein